MDWEVIDMAFNIRFVEITNTLGHGEIVLDQFAEHFESPLDFWTVSDYEKQWKVGVSRILDGETKSVLVTAMYPPDTANFIMWWVIYRDGSTVVFRNHMLLTDQLPQPFDVRNIYNLIPDRLPSDDTEFPVSEWSVSFASMNSFLRDKR